VHKHLFWREENTMGEVPNSMNSVEDPEPLPLPTTCPVWMNDRINELEATLRKIADPISFFRREAEEEGVNLDGYTAAQLSNDAELLKQWAKESL
jgi:hypothetical protein